MSNIILPRIWRSFMKIEEIKHLNIDNECIWEDAKIPNMLHLGGEEMMLQLAFDTDAGATVPSAYYIGLDNRTTISVDDTMGSLISEPSTNSYERQSVSSVSGFSITNVSTGMKAISAVVTFEALGGSWGPVNSVFLSTTDDNSGILMSSAALSSARTLSAGETLSLIVSISLTQC